MLTTQSVDSARRNESAYGNQPCSDFQQCLQTAKTAGARNQAGAPPQNHNDQTVTVKSGDTLWGIAQQHGTSLGALLAANPQFNPHKADGVLNFDRSHYGQWDPDYIRPGDSIRLPNHPSQTQHQPHTRQRQHPHQRPHHAERPHHPGERPHHPRHGQPPHGPTTPTHPQHHRPPHGPGPHPHPPHHGGPHPNPPHQRGPHPNPSPHGGPPSSPPQTGTPTAPPQSAAPTSPPQSATPTTPATPGKHSPGTPSFVPIPLHRLIPSKAGFGIENAWKFSKTPTIGGEPYAKFSWTLRNTPGQELNLNLKLKYTPNAKYTVRTFEQSGSQSTPGKKPPLLQRLKDGLTADKIKAGIKPEKVSVDAGLVVNKKVEVGGSLEFKGKQVGRSFYLSEKDPSNILVDTHQFKVAKVDPKEVVSSAYNGARESIASRSWAPFKEKVFDSVRGTELTLSGEKAVVNPHGPVSGFTNYAAKTTVGDIKEALKAPAGTPPGFARWAGFGIGTSASFVGGAVMDEALGKHIGYQPLRKAVDGFGAGLTGVAADQVTQKVLPGLVSKAAASPAWTKVAEPVLSKSASVLGKLTTPVLSKAGSLLTKTGSALKVAEPVLSKVGSVLGKVAPDLSKAAPALRILGKVARIGGPAGALVAGIPDGISAVNDFRHGDTAGGLKSVGKAAIRVGCTAIGATLGSALGPLGTVGGAVVGGFVGDFFAGLF